MSRRILPPVLLLLLAPGLAIAIGPPAFHVTPTDLDFGPVGVGSTSPSQIVTVTNHSAVLLGGFAGGAPGDAQFKALQNCASGVAPGESCQFTFSFAPTQTGSFTTTSTVFTDGGTFTITLRGNGVGAELSASPLSLDFGRVIVGETSAPQTVVVRNSGLADLDGFAGGAPADSQFQAMQNCALGVSPGGSCMVTYTFTPSATGAASSSSTVSTAAGSFRIDLAGQGRSPSIIPLAPLLWVTPLTLDFGPVGVGVTSPVQTVTITNQGAATLGDFAGGAPGDAQFSATQNCASGVAPGESCQYFFRFTPTGEGSFTTTSNTSTNAGSFAIELRGTGAGAELTASPLALDFGPVPIGTTSATQAVTIHNVGLATLDAFAGGGVPDSQFSVTQNCAAGVPPMDSCQYFFSFTPTLGGYSYAASRTSTNAGPIRIEVQGYGAGGLNEPPTAVDDSYSIVERRDLEVADPGVLANDTDTEGDTLMAALVTAPQHGTLSLSTDGGFSYLADAGFNGVDQFTYQAGDASGNSNEAVVSIEVVIEVIFSDGFE